MNSAVTIVRVISATPAEITAIMAAEIIASFPDLGVGLGQLLENARTASDMAMVFEAILLILFVGIAIDLLIFSPLERWVLRSRGLLVKS